MRPKPYRRLPSSTQLLLDRGYLRSAPRQDDRSDLIFADGVDIIYRFRDVTPSRFRAARDIILQAAADECKRYRELEYKFAMITTRLRPSTRRPRGSRPILKTYTAANQADGDIMVFGGDDPSILSLTDRVEEILSIPDEYEGITSYVVLQMIICVRNTVKPKEE